jgi:hypothetical protein
MTSEGRTASERIAHSGKGDYLTKRLVTIPISLLLAIPISCSDKSTGPESKPEPYYRVIYSYVQPPISVLTFDSRNGEVLDSTWYPGEPYRDLVFSADGQYSYGTGRVTRIIRTATGDTVAADWEHIGYELVLSPDEKYLAVIGSQMMSVFALPALTQVYEKAATSFWARFRPEKELLYFMHATPGLEYYNTLRELDLGASPPVERSISLTDSAGIQVPPGPMEFSGDGKWMLMIFYNWIFLVDADSMEVTKIMKSLHFTDANYTGIKVHPDGKRAFLGYYDLLYEPDVGGLDVFDFSTRSLSNFIDHVTVPGFSEPFRPALIQFTPDGKEMLGVNIKMFPGCYIFRLDLATKTLTQFTAHRGEYPRVLRIFPRLQYD